jgi:hypothetical protein
LLDKDGKSYTADDALTFDDGTETRLLRKVSVRYTGTEHFYSVGSSRVSLPAGAYRMKVSKGPEYSLLTCEVRIQAGETTDLLVKMTRWIDLSEKGWYSADDHLHLRRSRKESNTLFSKLMQAEDLHVANLLPFGDLTWGLINVTQYAHGEGGFYQEGNYILASGQENPRTNILGHTIILGADAPIHLADTYVLYHRFWEEARRRGGLSGYAHYGTLLGADQGLAIDLPSGLLTFLEVLQHDDAVCDVWYEILSMGFRITPTAGTDYATQISTNYPGRDRFYTKVQGPLTYTNWLEGVRRGRTFVTNGPFLEFHVEGKDIGEDVLLEKPKPVIVEGRVRFDPTRDDIDTLDVMRNGEVLRTFSREEASRGEISCRFRCETREACWLALRARGTKRGEQAYPATSVAHSAPIYVTVEGMPTLSAQPRAKVLAQAWATRLENLEKRLGDDKIGEMAADINVITDGVDIGHLRKNRLALLQAIRKAGKHFSDQAR